MIRTGRIERGIRSGTALAAQCEDDRIWGPDEFPDDRRDHGKAIVHGHWFAAEPVVLGNRVDIDTGAYATGRLTCLVLEAASRRIQCT